MPRERRRRRTRGVLEMQWTRWWDAGWNGGMESGTDIDGEHVDAGWWEFSHRHTPGLTLRVLPSAQGGLRAATWCVNYCLGRRAWSARGTCRSVDEALRRAWETFQAHRVEAWRAAWGVRGSLWAWRDGRWEHVADVVRTWPEKELGTGVFAVRFEGESVWYLDVGDCVVGGGNAPRGAGVRPLTEREAA